MSTEAFGDNLKKFLPDIADAVGDKLKDLLTPAPGQNPPVVVAPTPAPATDSGTWVRWGVLLLISLLGWWKAGMKDPIVIPAPPMAQVQSAPECPCVKGAK